MLRELLVEGLGVIERAELSLEPGNTALTGETGAGKTLVVAAVGLLLGGRADRSMVRQDSGEARIEGRFEVEPSHPAVAILLDHGILGEPPAQAPVEIVIFRTIGMGGGGRIRVNGHMATSGLVQELGASLVEIAGQQEHQRLGTPAYQRALLDAYAGDDAVGLARDVVSAVRAAAAARREAEEAQAHREERVRELDVLRHEVAEIDGAGLAAGEWARLSAEVHRLEHAEAIASGTAEALALLRDDNGAGDALRRASDALVASAERDPSLKELATRLEAASIEVSDVGQELAGRVVEPDPVALAQARERLDVLGRLRRKYGAEDEAALLARLEASRARVVELESADSSLAQLNETAETEASRASELAKSLSELRRAAAAELGREATAAAQRLAMPGSRVEVSLTPCELYEGGVETVELQLASTGEKGRPLAKIASGGELSRISLALYLLIRGERGATTMIFDEVDAGVGGEAARAVGEALSDLARDGAQAIVVTHLPQVAAFASAHFRVVKEEAAGRVRASVRWVEGEDRIEELSRMLSGMPGSERAREHAQELLELAAGR